MKRASQTNTIRRLIPVFAFGLLAPCASPVPSTQAQHIAFVQSPTTGSAQPLSNLADTVMSKRYRKDMRVLIAEADDIEKTLRVISNEFACATDPSFDHAGDKLLFSGKRSADDPLSIWRWQRSQNDLKPLEGTSDDCVTPIFLPRDAIGFASNMAREYEEQGGLRSLSLYSLEPYSTAPSRLTYNPSSDFEPVILRDGRLLFSSWQHVGNHHWPTGIVALMLINADGTGLFPFSGNHRGPWLKRGIKPWGSGRVVFIHAEQFDDFGAGELVAVDFNDSFAQYETLVPGDAYRVSDAAPLPDGRLLVSARPTDGSRKTFGLYLYDKNKLTLLYDDPDHHELSPAAPWGFQPEPRASTVVGSTPHGYLAILNCYETDRTEHHPIRPGSIKAVRVVEGRPLRHDGTRGPVFVKTDGRDGEPLIHAASATGYIPSRILGEVPPAEDGSVYLKVPADRPLRLQLVGQDGFVTVNERAWFWVRPNERRVCIGCHENRELAPSNAVPLAVRREPTDLTDPSGWTTVSFREDIKPILTTTCGVVGCHRPPRPTAGMNLTADIFNGRSDAAHADRYGPAYANLLARQEGKPFAVGGRRVHPGDALRSPMLWMLYGRALAPQYEPAPFERPMVSAHPGPMLPEAQLELIRKWIDLGAPYDSVAPPGPWPFEFNPVKQVVMEEKSDAK